MNDDSQSSCDGHKLFGRQRVRSAHGYGQGGKKPSARDKSRIFVRQTSDENVAYKVKRKKEEGAIDAFFYESVQSDYLADALDAL